MDTHTEKEEEPSIKKIKQDTVSSKKNGLPPPNIVEFTNNKKNLTDSLPQRQVDSMYRALLEKEGINIDFTIIKTKPVMTHSATRKFTIRIDEKNESAFTTRKVPVGLMSPTLYYAVFRDPTVYVLKKISMQLLLSVLLIAFTTLSFVFIYRSLLAQKRLTAIKNEFISNITHELKTPIATVSVAIEAMKNFNALQSPELRYSGTGAEPFIIAG